LPPKWIIPSSLVLSGLSIVACTMVCFTASIPLIKWIVLGVCVVLGIPVLVVWAISSLTSIIIDTLSGFARNFLDLLVDLGNSILSKFPSSISKRGNTQEEDQDNRNHHNDSVIVEDNKSSKDNSIDDESKETNFNEIKNSRMGFDPFG